MHPLSLPLLPAQYLVGHPGTSPALTVPARFGRLADVDAAWAHLAETADFFATPMPTADAFRDACERFLRRAASWPLVAVRIIVVELEGTARALVTGRPVAPTRSEPVRIDVSDHSVALARPSDPPWRKMAARTTSQAVEDRLRRRLADRGCADGIGDDALPLLGALVFERGDETYGLDNPEPTSVLDQLLDCGAVVGVRRIDRVLADADRSWWISPDFAAHPVSAIGAVAYRVQAGTPTFTRSR